MEKSGGQVKGQRELEEWDCGREMWAMVYGANWGNLSFYVSKKLAPGGLTFICSIKFIQIVLGYFVRGGAKLQEKKKAWVVGFKKSTEVYLRKTGAKQVQPTLLIRRSAPYFRLSGNSLAPLHSECKRFPALE